jgi:hypothetical protein
LDPYRIQIWIRILLFCQWLIKFCFLHIADRSYINRSPGSGSLLFYKRFEDIFCQYSNLIMLQLRKCSQKVRCTVPKLLKKEFACDHIIVQIVSGCVPRYLFRGSGFEGNIYYGSGTVRKDESKYGLRNGCRPGSAMSGNLLSRSRRQI